MPDQSQVQKQVEGREWAYWPEPDGEPFFSKEGAEVLGWANRAEGDDQETLRAGFEAFALDEGHILSPGLTLRPILARTATDVECRINGWEEGTFVRCTARAKNHWPMWQIEIAATKEPSDA